MDVCDLSKWMNIDFLHFIFIIFLPLNEFDQDFD